MSVSHLKSPRVKLNSEAYRILHRSILERDAWRCQMCGSMQLLQVHHINFRSRSGDDTEANLITLCAECHAQVHCGH
jgi:5-methylcytosine-specific restriction endonuclease McrA